MLPDMRSVVAGGMVAEIDDLCASIRRGAAPIYSDLLRQNVLDVMRCSFPAFSRCLGDVCLASFAADFLKWHMAILPRFHEMAVELVRFAQGRKTLSPWILGLMEYEWALLATEIDERQVPGPRGRLLPGGDPFEVELQVNPTLRVVMVPFDAAEIDVLEADAEGGFQHVYGIYRTSRHVVMSQELGTLECLLIDKVQKDRRLHRAGTEFENSSGSPGAAVADWLRWALKNELVHLGS